MDRTRGVKSLVCLVCMLVMALGAPGSVSADDGQSDDGVSEAEERKADTMSPWEGVRELAAHDRKEWFGAIYDIAAGSSLVTAGALRLARHRSRGRASAGRWDFPWFGLYFTLTGAGTLGTGIYLAARKSEAGRYPKAMMRADLSERAARLYLEHRARVAKRERVMSGISVMASTVAGGVYVMSLPKPTQGQKIEYWATGGGTAAIGIGLGIWQFVRRTRAERIIERLEEPDEPRPMNRTARLRVAPVVGPKSPDTIQWGLRMGLRF